MRIPASMLDKWQSEAHFKSSVGIVDICVRFSAERGLLMKEVAQLREPPIYPTPAVLAEGLIKRGQQPLRFPNRKVMPYK